MVYAEHQDEYQNLPVWKDKHSVSGNAVSCWGLSWKDRLKALFFGRIYLCQMTFHENLQPIYLTLNKWEVLDKDLFRPDFYKGAVMKDDHIYWYEYRLARPGMSVCLFTEDPTIAHGGLYLYKGGDTENGWAHVITKTTNSKAIHEAHEITK